MKDKQIIEISELYHLFETQCQILAKYDIAISFSKGESKTFPLVEKVIGI